MSNGSLVFSVSGLETFNEPAVEFPA